PRPRDAGVGVGGDAMTDERGAAVLRPLRLEEDAVLPPSRVDLGGAVRKGRRRQRIRAAAAVGAATVAVLAVTVIVRIGVGAPQARPAVEPSGSARPPASAPPAPPLGTCTAQRQTAQPWSLL